MDQTHSPPIFIEPPAIEPAPSRPAPPARARRSRALIVAVALLVAAAGTGLGIRARDSGSSTSANDVVATAPSRETLPTVAPRAPAASTALDTDAIVARVDPAVVDVTTTLDGGRGAGTGMVLTPSGLVLTNNHVIEGATRIEVQIAGTGPTHAAHVVGYDATHDVALIQVEDVSDLTTITVGDTSTLGVGDRVVAIGNALGAPGAHAVTTGSIEALKRTITAGDVTGSSETLQGLIQVDATLQPGDSGGPLVNRAGQVIGMNTAASVGRRRTSMSNVGFAVPIDDALAIARQIQAGEGSATVHIGDRAILGVQVTQSNRLATDGVTVAAVEEDSPAAGAGIRGGDVITAVDGTRVSSLDDVQAALHSHSPGDRVRVTWTSAAGTTRSATVQLVAGPPA